MENKSSGTKKFTYFCFRDKMNTGILWFVPMSTKYEKYWLSYKYVIKYVRNKQFY